MPDLDVLIAAIQSRAWWPVVGLGAAVLLSALRTVLPVYWESIPTKWKPLPALVIVALAALADAYARGDTIPVAVSMVLLQVLTAWPTALGAADAALRLSGVKAPSVTTAERGQS